MVIRDKRSQDNEGRLYSAMRPFCADQNGVIKNFAVVMSSIVERADYNINNENPQY